VLVRRRHLVEVAVAAQERQQLGEVAARTRGDLVTAACSSPTVSPAAGRQPLEREQTPGTNASRENVSWRIVSSCPRRRRAPPDVRRGRAGGPSGSAVVAEQLRGRLRGAGRASCFASLCSSTISRARQVLGRVLGKAHHQNTCAESEIRSVKARHAALARERIGARVVEAGRPDHRGTPCSRPPRRSPRPHRAR
jgi:hypothetical protein